MFNYFGELEFNFINKTEAWKSLAGLLRHSFITRGKIKEPKQTMWTFHGKQRTIQKAASQTENTQNIRNKTKIKQKAEIPLKTSAPINVWAALHSPGAHPQLDWKEWQTQTSTL